MTRFLFSGLLILAPLFLSAQFKNILVDPGSLEKPPYEPVVAINKDDPKNIVIISALNNVYYSANSALSWTKSQINSPETGDNPILLSDFKGNLCYFHLSGKKNSAEPKSLNRIVVHQSDDAGETWSEGSFIAGLDPLKHQLYADVTVDRKGNWYATWTQFDSYGSTDSGCQSTILLSTSSNGKKWSRAEQISQASGDCKDNGNSAVGSSVAVTSDGSKIFVMWINQNKILLDRSFDGGKMWLSEDMVIEEKPSGSVLKIPGINKCNGLPQLVCDNTKSTKLSGALYAVWADQRNGENDTDILFMRSMSLGDNWTRPFSITNDNKGKHQFMPSMTVDAETGYIYIVYYDRKNYDDLQTDVYLAYSVDAGSTFKNMKISETPFTPDSAFVFGDYIGISAHQGIITPVWTRMDNGKTSIWTTVIKHDDLVQAK